MKSLVERNAHALRILIVLVALPWLLLAWAFAAEPEVDGPDVYYGEDGCRYVKKARPRSPPKTSLLIQWAKPPSAPASAASAPHVVKKKRRVSKVPPKREEMPGYVREDCDELRPPTPLEVIIPPIPLVPDETPPPLFSAPPGPELSPPLFVPELPPPESLEEPTPPPFGFPPACCGSPPLIIVPPYFVPPYFVPPIVPPILVPPTPIPEPQAWYLLLAGLGAIAVWRRRR